MTSIVSVKDIAAAQHRFIFCTIPAWAKYAVVDNRGDVLGFFRTASAALRFS